MKWMMAKSKVKIVRARMKGDNAEDMDFEY